MRRVAAVLIVLGFTQTGSAAWGSAAWGSAAAGSAAPAQGAGRVGTLSLAVAHLTPAEQSQLPARGVVAWDSADHEMGALLPRHALSITATYGAAGQIKAILGTLRWAATGQPVATALVR